MESTGLPSSYRHREGFVVAAAINKYMFIGLNRTFIDDKYVLKYSEFERREQIDHIGHRIVRAAFD